MENIKLQIHGLVFSMQSIKAIACHLLTRESNPLRYFLTYKLSQDSVELLFSKIRHRYGWNNNPNAVQFKYALHRILGWNSIEPSKRGNCTPFEDSLTQVGGLVSFSSKRQMLIQSLELLIKMPSWLNTCSCSMTSTIHTHWKTTYCTTLLATLFDHFWQKVSLWDMQRGTTAYSYWWSCFTTVCGCLVCQIQSLQAREGGLVFPSTAVFNVVRVTESAFCRHVLGAGTSVPNEKNTDLKIQSIVFEQMSTKMFSTNPAHLFDHKLGEERDYTSLLKLVISKYLHLRLTTYSKKLNELIVHANKPSLRHTLTKIILFKNQ